MPGRQTFVAEVKTRAPDGYRSKESWTELFELAHQHGDIISVHTGVEFGGSWALLEHACKRSTKPVLAKGFHPHSADVNEAFKRGATYVLQVASAVYAAGVNTTYSDDEHVWIETDTLTNFNTLLRHYTKASMVWNTRCYGKPNMTPVADLFDILPPGQQVIQASYITKPQDIHPKATGYIVGKHLKTFIQHTKERAS